MMIITNIAMLHIVSRLHDRDPSPSSLFQDAVLVNASRGAVVDEEALVAHMQKNPKFRAGLDVFEVKYEQNWEENERMKHGRVHKAKRT